MLNAQMNTCDFSSSNYVLNGTFKFHNSEYFIPLITHICLKLIITILVRMYDWAENRNLAEKKFDEKKAVCIK